MAQPKELRQDEDNNKLDRSQVYCTNAIIKRVGRAIAIDLNQCMLPGNAKNKHMTILFRRSGKWTSHEIELVSKETDNWIKEKYGSSQAPVTFTIDIWGKKSVKILGDLNQLCLYLRSTFNSMTNDSQRLPHCELFTNSHKGKGRGKQKERSTTKRNNDQFSKEKLTKMIDKIQKLKSEKYQEILLLNEQENELQALLSNCDNLDCKILKNEIKNIAKTFKIKKKEMKFRRKSFKKGRISLSTLNNLPLSILNIYIDGYNLIGSDSICHKLMISKEGGIKKSRQRLIKLLQENFMNKIKNHQLTFNYNINNINLWFDGNGKNNQYQDIKITFSTKKQIVDDKLIELFNKNDKNDNKNILVITNNKELTLKLYQIGVKVMKSSIFYEKYLKEENKNEDDTKEETSDEDYYDNDDEFRSIFGELVS